MSQTEVFEIPWGKFRERIFRISCSQMYSNRLKDPDDIANSTLRTYARRLREGEEHKPTEYEQAWDVIRKQMNRKLAKARYDENKRPASLECDELTETLLRAWRLSDADQQEQEAIAAFREYLERALNENFHDEQMARIAAMYIQAIPGRKIADELNLSYGVVEHRLRQIRAFVKRLRDDPDAKFDR